MEAELLDCTPRKIAALLFVADRRRKRDLGDMLAIQALAASGDSKAIQKQLKALSDE